MLMLVLFCCYLCVLIILAWIGKRRAGSKTPHDFYLAGGKLGFLVLICTLFATQYSGNTFMGFPGKAYRMGYAYMMSVMFMMCIVTFYLSYAPALRARAVLRRYVTPCDWIHDRYRNRGLTSVCAVLMCIAMLNYLLAQLLAMGNAVEGLTGRPGSFAAGVLFLSVVIVVYETVGGMRAVAWTDTIQGILMLVAVLILGGYLLTRHDELALLPARILELEPEKVRPPDWRTCATWLSFLLIAGLGGAMYPQGIQRIYAARSTRVLKWSLCAMVLLPLLTVFFAYFMGILAIEHFPGLAKGDSDQVMARMLDLISTQGPVLYIGVTLLLLGALAAMMSTADSVLLSLSSIVIQDIFVKTIGYSASDEKLLKLGKISSWALMGIVVVVALQLQDTTLFRLLVIKFELLVQVAPAFILGFYLPRLGAGTALVGIAAGCAVALTGFALNTKWAGIHPGTIGVAVNLLICLVGSYVFPSESREQEG
jgi:Na+/proline symporter